MFYLPALYSSGAHTHAHAHTHTHTHTQTHTPPDAHWALTRLAESPYDVVSIDWTIDPGEARNALSKTRTSIQGNLDPVNLYAGTIDAETGVEGVAAVFVM